MVNRTNRLLAALFLATWFGLLPAGPVAQPAEVIFLDWCPENRECLEWTATAGAEQYRLYRGVSSGLPALLDISIDSCLRSTHESAGSGRSVFEAPLPGGMFWYLATAENTMGEGPPGNASSGARLLDSAGDCPFECNPDYAPNPNVGLVEEPGNGGCPDGMLAVDAFCIDQYEAALVQVDTGQPWSPFFKPDGVRVRAVSQPGAIPQGYIDQTEATAACAEAGKRLCTDAEWLRACRGPTGTTYPYGDTFIADACNDTRETHPLIEYFGTTEPWIWTEIDHPCLNQLPASLEPTGTRSTCETFEGSFDMVGNLLEWTSTPTGTLRGGFYVDSVMNGSGCLYVTTAHNVFHSDFATGFRCCSDP